MERDFILLYCDGCVVLLNNIRSVILADAWSSPSSGDVSLTIHVVAPDA